MQAPAARRVIALENGARIVFDPMPHVSTASVGVYLGAGARHEAEELAGLAHFLEHMAFKGAAGRNAQQLAEAVEARGAIINAATDYERTSYFVRSLAGDAPEMLDVALSMVFSPDHPPDEVEREKGVVLQELAEAADQPDDLVMELAQAAGFPGHALGRSILGAEDTLAQVARDDLFAFARSAYGPSRTVVSVAGAFDAAAVEVVARRWLEQRPALPALASDPPPAVSGDVRVAERRLEQSHLVLGRGGPSATAPERFAGRLFVEIFGGGMASRLFQEVREKRGLAYTIEAANESYADAGRITVYAGCAAEDAEEVARITAGIWADMAANGVTVQELDRAKAVLKTQLAMAAEAPASRAGTAAYELLMHGQLIEMPEVMQRIDAVMLEDVRRAAGGSPGYAAVVGPHRGLRAATTFVEAIAAG